MDFDLTTMGDVCPRCSRVYSDKIPANTLHFATEAAAMARMRRDQRERHNMSVSTRGAIEAILGVAKNKK